MDLTEYRATPAEQQRTADLLRLTPSSGRHALDIGARDGHFSMLMVDRFNKVVALDLTKPNIAHPRIECIEGNAAKMPFSDRSFDFVFCAEVLEHVPTANLSNVCREIERVACDKILIGVPYKQDIRVGRTTCHSCGNVNPPWGHVNSFDEKRLAELFGLCTIETSTFVGESSSRTNSLSAALMDFAGNPYGTYDQDEVCIHCGEKLLAPPQRSLAQLVATKLAFWSRKASELRTKPHGNWLHTLLRKRGDV
jgi:hypothetical protein